MSEVVYKIAKWTETFETADSRRHKSLHWISIPLGFNSNGYVQLIEQFGDEAPAIYGAWIALANIAATCPIRGILSTSSGDALTVGRLSFLSHFPSTVFGKLISWASSDSVGWLEKLSPDEVKRRLIDCESIGNQSPNELPDQTRPDLTEPNTTRPDQTQRNAVGQSVGRGKSLAVLSEAQLLTVPAEQIEDVCRRIVRALPFSVSAKQLGRMVRIGLAAGVRGTLLEVANSLTSRQVRSPRRYWDAAVKKMVEEAGYDFDAAYQTLEQVASRPAVAASG